MKLKSVFIFVALLLAVFCSCSTENLDNNESSEGTASATENATRIVFGLKKQGRSLSERSLLAADLPQSDEKELEYEKKLDNVYVAIFQNDITGSNKDTQLYEILKLDISKGTDAISFIITNPGRYNLFFMGNVPDGETGGTGGLLAKLKALKCISKVSKISTPAEPESSASTFKDFSDIVLDADVDELSEGKKSILMTSRLIANVEVRNNNNVVDLGIVGLDRVVARFDIINAYTGLTIDKVVFKKRTVKSSLCVNEYKLNTDYLESADKAFDKLALVGNSQTPAKYEGKIYSYEQLAGESQMDQRMSVEIHYHLGDGTRNAKTVNVDFIKVSNSGDKDYLRIERNHLYRISLNKASSIEFKIEVVDWVGGETFVRGEDDLWSGIKYDYTAIKVGDYILNDGGVIPYTKELTLTPEQKKQIVAVVYSTTPYNYNKEYTDPKMEIDHPQCNHGWAVSLKDLRFGDDSKNTIKWSEQSSFNFTSYLQSHRNDVWTSISTGGKQWNYCDYTLFTEIDLYNSTCPAKEVMLPVKYVMKYRTEKYLPFGSGWMLPVYYSGFYPNSPSSTVNQSLQKLDVGEYDRLSGYYWTCYQDASNVYGINFAGSNTTLSKTYEGKVRPVFAF